MGKLQLTMACWNYDRTRGLLEMSQTRWSAQRWSAIVNVRRRQERGSGSADRVGGALDRTPSEDRTLVPASS